MGRGAKLAHVTFLQLDPGTAANTECGEEQEFFKHSKVSLEVNGSHTVAYSLISTEWAEFRYVLT